MAEMAEDNIKEQLDAALQAIDVLNAKIDEYDAKFEALESNVKNSMQNAIPGKKEPLKDPGEFKIGNGKYRFASLTFRLGAPGTGVLTTYIAEAAVKDKALLDHILAKYPSTLVKV